MEFDKRQIGVVFEGEEIALAERAYTLASGADLLRAAQMDDEALVVGLIATEKVINGAEMICDSLAASGRHMAQRAEATQRKRTLAIRPTVRQQKHEQRMNLAKSQLMQARNLGRTALLWSTFLADTRRNLVCSEYQHRMKRHSA